MKKQTPFFLLLVVLSVLAGCTTSPVTNPFVCGTSTVTDTDGNVYHTVSIGSQCWTVENLKTTKFNDGTAILTGLDSAAWVNNTTGAYSIYKDNPTNDTLYGKLYNWSAVNTGKLAPTGWHVPDTTEWNTVATTLGGADVAGGKMKSTSSLWQATNVGATNSSGFTGLPGGNRSRNGYFNNPYLGTWWTTTAASAVNAYLRNLYSPSTALGFPNYTKELGCSIRCIKD